MTRVELLQLLIGQARTNGFEFRRWYVGKLGLPWQSARHAVEMLAAERRYYALLFSHDFASNFWKPGELMTFQVPMQSFTRKMKDGSIGTVKRKGYTRRSVREDAWLYHLKEMAGGRGTASVYAAVFAGGGRSGRRGRGCSGAGGGRLGRPIFAWSLRGALSGWFGLRARGCGLFGWRVSV